jgi:hypothetical protein
MGGEASNGPEKLARLLTYLRSPSGVRLAWKRTVILTVL